MSDLLQTVTRARELRDAAESEFRRALERAQAGGFSLREIAAAAGMSFNGVRWAIRRGRGEVDGYGKPLGKDDR